MTDALRIEPGENYAASLYREVGSEAFSIVAAWLREIAAETALEWDGRIIPSSTAWLAETVTEYDPRPPTEGPE